MREKEIKKIDVAGKNVEDLTEEELAEVQGQGSDDMNGEIAFTGCVVIPTVQPRTLGSKICR